MPIPSKERLSELVAELVERRGFDLEDVLVTPAGKHSSVRVVVDADAGVSLDDIAALSNEISVVLDDVSDFGETPYMLEVTTPGIDRPLTHERHWRRARGRKVTLSTATETFEGRIGELADGTIAVVVAGKPGPVIRPVALADVVEAVVQVEFNRPNERELALAGGIAAGRPVPGAQEQIEVEGTDK